MSPIWIFLGLVAVLGIGSCGVAVPVPVAVPVAVPLLRDPLLAADWGDDRCDRVSAEVIEADRKTRVDNPPKIINKWVSESCEVRPGPEFLLRSYTFLRNNTFRLVQFHYGDESCSMPLYTVSAKGRYELRGRSWLTPAATEAEYSLSRVTVTAQSSEVALELAARVNATCPGHVRRRWRANREYVVLSVNEDGVDSHQPRDNQPPGAGSSGSHLSFPRMHQDSEEGRWGRSSPGRSLRLLATSDMNCLSALQAAFHELRLIRSQRRPHRQTGRVRHELLLGDVHSRPDERGAYMPTAFQVPLLRADQAHGCDVCHAVSRASSGSPPHLHARPRLPAYLGGDWMSERCETRPLGLFLRRRLRVRAQDQTWQGEYQFYSDPACTSATFTATEAGRYVVGGASAVVQGGLDADFISSRAALTILDPAMTRNLRCGGLMDTEWQLGVPQDLESSHGCPSLGIIVPSIRYDLIRVDVDSWGQSLLYLGQADTDNRRGGPHDRPTAYQPPLLRCRGMTPIYDPGTREDYLDLIQDNLLTSASKRSAISDKPLVAMLLLLALFL